MKNWILIAILLTLLTAGILYRITTPQIAIVQKKTTSLLPKIPSNPLQITEMKKRSYPGSDIKIEQTLSDGENYKQYIASYLSDGLKIYGLLTIPNGQKPPSGWPVILFNHGYIPPLEYKTTERYVAYVAAFAREGYIVFKPDYRGNGTSEGKPEGAYYSPAYTIDDLNALASLQKYKDANPERIGVWGHSMGGNIALRDVIIRPSAIKAAVIWGGVVGSYDQLTHWHDPTYHPSAYELTLRNRYRTDIEKKYGSLTANPAFWHSIDPTYFTKDITAPIQLHQGENDEEVPASFSATLYNNLKNNGQPVEMYLYPGADHNISQAFDIAMQRSIAFFAKYLK